MGALGDLTRGRPLWLFESGRRPPPKRPIAGSLRQLRRDPGLPGSLDQAGPEGSPVDSSTHWSRDDQREVAEGVLEAARYKGRPYAQHSPNGPIGAPAPAYNTIVGGRIRKEYADALAALLGPKFRVNNRGQIIKRRNPNAPNTPPLGHSPTSPA